MRNHIINLNQLSYVTQIYDIYKIAHHLHLPR